MSRILPRIRIDQGHIAMIQPRSHDAGAQNAAGEIGFVAGWRAGIQGLGIHGCQHRFIALKQLEHRQTIFRIFGQCTGCAARTVLPMWVVAEIFPFLVGRAQPAPTWNKMPPYECRKHVA